MSSAESSSLRRISQLVEGELSSLATHALSVLRAPNPAGAGAAAPSPPSAAHVPLSVVQSRPPANGAQNVSQSSLNAQELTRNSSGPNQSQHMLEMLENFGRDSEALPPSAPVPAQRTLLQTPPTDPPSPHLPNFAKRPSKLKTSQLTNLSFEDETTADGTTSLLRPSRHSAKVRFPPFPALPDPVSSLNSSAKPVNAARKKTLFCRKCGATGRGADTDCIPHNLACVGRAVDLSASKPRSLCKKTLAEGTSFTQTSNSLLASRADPRALDAHYSYLSHLQRQLKKAEEERTDFRKKTLEAESRAQTLRQAISGLTMRDQSMERSGLGFFESILRTNKLKKQRQMRMLEDQERARQESLEVSRRAAEKENQAVEGLLTERRMRIIQNIAKIRNRSELRRQQNLLADKMISALKQVSGI